MATTFNVISLGVYTDIDPTEGNSTVESASDLVGLTFGSSSDPLLNHIAVFAPGSGGYSGGFSNAYDTNNNFSTDHFTIDGVDHTHDSSVIYNATITYTDGTTATVTATIFQDMNGNLFWAPEMSFNSEQAAMEAKPIESLHIDSVQSDNFTGLAADRDPWDGAVVCFASGTLIKTLHGDVAVEDLRAGNDVQTLDNGYQTLRWIGSRTITARELTAHPNLRPIRICAGALGANQPKTDLVLSPQHRVLVRSKVAERMFGASEILIAAKHLLELDGIDVAEDLTTITYWHFLFEQHQIVLSNGAATESLFTGPEALKSVSLKAREEIFAIFPGLRTDPKAGLSPVRPLVLGHRARKLVKRVANNGKRLVA